MWRAVLDGLGWGVSAWLLLTVGVLTLVSLAPSAGTDIVSLGAVHALVLGAISYALAWRNERDTLQSGQLSDWAKAFGLHEPRAGALIIGAAVGLCAKFPADGLRALVELVFPTGEMELMHQMRLLRHDTLGQTLALFLIIGFTGPLLEELFYRGALFRRIATGGGLMAAWLLTSAVFALSHGAMRDWPSLLIVALAFGFLRGVFGTVWACLSAHVAFNSATLAALVLGYQEVDENSLLPLPLAVGGAIAVVLLLAYARRFHASAS